MSTKVLVIDDEFAYGALFKLVFGEHVTVCCSVAELDEHVARGERWDLAFVDFSLDPLGKERSGLSALMALRDSGAARSLVSYTQLGESGRALYMAAAKAWFSVDATLDKGMSGPENLERFSTMLDVGQDPTAPNLRRMLAKAEIIDRLIPNPFDVRLWRAWSEFDGSERAVRACLQIGPSVTRGFKDYATAAVHEFEYVFFGRTVEEPAEGDYSNLKGALTGFASRHRSFFRAADLDRAITWRDGHAAS